MHDHYHPLSSRFDGPKPKFALKKGQKMGKLNLFFALLYVISHPNQIFYFPNSRRFKIRIAIYTNNNFGDEFLSRFIEFVNLWRRVFFFFF